MGTSFIYHLYIVHCRTLRPLIKRYLATPAHCMYMQPNWNPPKTPRDPNLLLLFLGIWMWTLLTMRRPPCQNIRKINDLVTWFAIFRLWAAHPPF